MGKEDQITFDDIILVKPSETLLNEITKDLMNDRFYCLDSAIDKKALTEFKYEIESLIADKGQRYFSLINHYKNIKSKFNLLDKSKNLKGSLLELAKLGSVHKYYKSQILNVLRVVAGKKTSSQSLKFHYGDPHHDSLLLNFIAKIRHFRERVNSKK